jgi:hypothetical protein
MHTQVRLNNRIGRAVPAAGANCGGHWPPYNGFCLSKNHFFA